MNETEKRVVRWVSGISAAVAGIAAVVMGAPGDLIPQGYTLALVAASAGLSGFVTFMASQQDSEV